MRICIFGAGAVGGHFAARLAAAGHQVSAVARGANLAALRERGIELRVADKRFTGKVKASDRPGDLGEQDLVISTLKAPTLPALAQGIAPLLGKHTKVIFALNGVPWWYAQHIGARPAPPDLGKLDPHGALAKAVASERILGGVIYSSNEMIAPGIVVNQSPYDARLVIGAIDDRQDGEIESLRVSLREAGFDSPPVADIRKAVWDKLVRNMSGSTLCLLTGQKLTVVVADPALAEITRRLLLEGIDIAVAHGMDVSAALPQPGGPRRRVPDHKPSILQDYELGRAMEIEAIILATQSFARIAKVPSPTLDVIAAVATRMAIAKGLYASEAGAGS